MSETERPAEVLLTTPASGTGPPENTRDGIVSEKTDKENGIKKAPVEETGTHEQKDEDVKMTDAADAKIGEQGEQSSGGEVELLKVKGEEKEREELKDGQEAEEKGEVTKEKHKEAGEKTEDAREKSDGAKGKSEVGNEEKGEESAEKGEETDEKGEESEEKGEEAEEKGNGAEKKSEEFNGKETEENEEDKGTRKRQRGRRAGEKSEGKGKKESGKTKGVLRTPTPSSIDRPVRQRKTVERLVEIVEKVPSKAFRIEKGRGTPLKDIPNVAYKLSKKKPADIRSLHLLLFGRKGKAINFKSHLFQFSGFVWHENEDKQRTKVKEKLDKCAKDKLLDLCHVFDIPVSRTTTRKEDIVAMLLDFMVAPHATTNVILAEKEQSAKSRKRKRMSRSALKSCVSVKHSRKRTKSENTSKSEQSSIETEGEGGDGDTGEEDKENGLPHEDEAIGHSESEEGEESEHGNSEKESQYSGKGRQGTKKLPKERVSPASAKSKQVTTPKKAPQPASTKSPHKPSSKRSKVDEAKDSNVVFSRKKKNVVTPQKKAPSSKPDMVEKKTSGKKAGRSKAKTDLAERSGPTEEELRKTICEILKEVDFNTATFTDILKRLASHYNVDLTTRKASIKLMIQDELTKLADEAEDEDDDSEDGDTEKAENSEHAGREAEA